MSDVTYVCGCTQDKDRELATDLKRTEVGHPHHEVWHDEEYAKSVMRGEQADESGRWLCGCVEDGPRSSDPIRPDDPRHADHAAWHRRPA